MSTGLILMFAAGLAAAAAVPGTSEASRLAAVMVWFTVTFVVLGGMILVLMSSLATGQVRTASAAFGSREGQGKCGRRGAERMDEEEAHFAMSDRPARVLWSVRFDADGDELDVPVCRGVMSSVEMLYDRQPDDVELLFAATGTDGDAVTASPDLHLAAERLLALAHAMRRDLRASATIITTLHQVRQFAREHPFARIERTVERHITVR